MQETSDIRIIDSHAMRDKLSKDPSGSWCARPKIGRLVQLIKGFYGGELTVITGPTKNGKTLFAQTLTHHFAMDEIKCLWFSYEVPARQFLEQFGDNLPIFWLPEQLKAKDINWVYRAIKTAVQDPTVKIVFIDHLHFLFDILQSGNPSLHIGGIVRSLKGIAKEQDVHIFLIAHMGKVGKDKDGKWRDPEAGDTRDSSFIEQECDNTLAIWRGRESKVNAKLKIIHNRRFGVFDEVIMLTKQGPYLTELPEGHTEPQETKKWSEA